MKLAPHPFSLRQLQYAIAVADFGGFRKAAEACHVSQPALSAQLRAMEDVLGAPLFERDTHRVLPTAAGAMLLDRARAVVAAADELVETGRRLGDPLASTLRIGVIPTLGAYLVPELVPPLSRAFPSLRIRWVEDRTHRLRAALEAGELDAALLAVESELGSLSTIPVGIDRFLLALPLGHPLAKGAAARRGAALSIDDVPQDELLVLEDGHCLRDQILAACGAAPGEAGALRATSLSTLAQMVAAGLGVTLLPRCAAPLENRHGRLVLRPLRDPEPYRTVALAFRPTSPYREAFARLARAASQALREVLDPPA